MGKKNEAPKKMHQLGDSDCYIKKINLNESKVHNFGEQRQKEKKDRKIERKEGKTQISLEQNPRKEENPKQIKLYI